MWSIAESSVVDLEQSHEPAFPCVRIFIDSISAFRRRAAVDGKRPTSASNPELIVLGRIAKSGVVRQFEVRVPVESHERSKAVTKQLRQVIVIAEKEKPRREKSSSTGGAAHGKLGISVGPLPHQMRELAGNDLVGGAGVVLKVVKHSRAFEADVREGDIVVRVDKKPLDMDDVSGLLRDAAMRGGEVELEIQRANVGRIVKVVRAEKDNGVL